jgi:uncharacterized membrane protein YgcG
MRRLLLILCFAASAQGRTLDWDLLAVKARLDKDGRLHVREEQSIVFDGDWNGGERVFRIEPGQTLQFRSISRWDPQWQRWIPLREGGLSAVDEYQFVNDRTLRWRSRLPGDPPFQKTRITYALDYTLANVLVKGLGGYQLDHNFVFPDRDGEIRRFTLDLDLAPEWKATGIEKHLEAGPLPPGRDLLVRGTLEYAGSAEPEARRSTFPVRATLALLVIVIPILLFQSMLGRERALGRLAPLDVASVNKLWIERNLLPIAAEVVGTAWDEDVGANEVSALLARWAGEGRIKTTVAAKDDLRMELLATRESFEGYERELIDKLFFDGDSTSTTEIRAHYRNRGFNPGSIVGRHLRDKVDALLRNTEPAPRIRKVATVILFVIAAVIFATNFKESVLAIAGVWLLGVLWMAGFFLALRWRGRIDHGRQQTISFAIPVALAVAVVVVILFLDPFRLTLQVGYVAAVLMVANSVLNAAKSKRGAQAIAHRKRLASVREYFIRELQKPAPAIDDRWFPYVIAFGLNDQASAWMASFGTAHAASTFSHSSSSGSSSSSTPSWSGGGGAFGGAGATASWGAAAAGMAAGVASASSSGGGGGGGSSGGGGGGGW